MTDVLSIRAWGTAFFVVLCAFFLSFAYANAAPFEPYQGNPVLEYSAQAGTFDEMRVTGPKILKVGSDYWMYYTGLENGNSTEIGLATSSDGVNWTRHPANPVMRCGENSPAQCATGGVWSNFKVQLGSVIFDEGIYKMWYNGDNVNLNGNAKVGYATSTDGVQWTSYSGNYIFPPNTTDAISLAAVMEFDGQYHMYFKRNSIQTELNLATSPDGITWTEHPNNPVLNSNFVSVDKINGQVIVLTTDGYVSSSNDGITFTTDTSEVVYDTNTVGTAFMIEENGVAKLWYSEGVGNVIWSFGNVVISYATTTSDVLPTADNGIVRVNVATDGTQGTGGTNQVSISGDGRYVVFDFDPVTTDLDPSTTYQWNIYERDVDTNVTTLISDLQPGLGLGALYPTISSDGENILFGAATEFDPPGGGYYVYEKVTDVLTSLGAIDPTDISATGRYTNDGSLLLDLDANTQQNVNVATDGMVYGPAFVEMSIASGGQLVAFSSASSNLAQNDTNGGEDVFIHDLSTGVTSLVSRTPIGNVGNGSSQEADISDDGRYIVYSSFADDLVAGDLNNERDIFLYDRVTQNTSRVSVESNGSEFSVYSEKPSISADGRYIAFSSQNGAIYVHEVQSGTTERVDLASDGSPANLQSDIPEISANGEFIAFRSLADNLVADDTNGTADVFRAENPLFVEAPNTPPTITLNGANPLVVTEGTTFSDPGVTATDPEDGDITANVVVGGDTVDENTPGTYVITYNVTDSGGLAATEVTRTVIVEALPDTGFEDTLILATNSTWVKQDSDILSGDVIVNGTTSGPYLDGNANTPLSIGVRVTAATGTNIISDDMRIKVDAVVSNVSYNTKLGNGLVTGTETTPLTLPVFAALPQFETATVGTTSVIAPSFATTTIDAGNYDRIVARATSTLVFTGGVYHANEVIFRRDSKVFFTAPTEIRIADKLNTDQRVLVGAGATAADVIFYVEGINGTGGGLNENLPAADIGIENNFNANVYAPNGRIWIKQDSNATGAFIARDVEVGVRVTLSEASGF